MSKRTGFKKLAIAAFCTTITSTAYCGTYAYISNAEDGDVSTYELTAGVNPHLNLLSRSPAGKLVMPMAASPDGKMLYAAVRTKPFSVYSFQINQKTGGLKWLGATPLADNMVNITTDKTGKWLLATSFAGYKNSVNQIKSDGTVNPEPAQVFPSGGVNPHAIVVDNSNKFVYVPQLGSDQIKIHAFNASLAMPMSELPSATTVQEQLGPRHLVISPDNKFAYVITEMAGQVLVFSRDLKTGALNQIQSISALPSDSKLVLGKPRPGTGTGNVQTFDDSNMIFFAEIKLTPNGKFLYASERTNSTLSGFEVDQQTGKLKYLFTIPTEQMPRGFGIDPESQFLVATGQKSDKVSLYSINPNSGELTLVERVSGGKGANWVTFVKTK